MSRIPDETLDEIRRRSDIVDVVNLFAPLKPKGRIYWGCCPFHHEKTPSFKVDPDLGVYYCFGCHAHGSTIDFVKNMVNTDFVGAVRWLADRYGVQIPEDTHGLPPDEAARLQKLREKRQALLNSVADYFHSQLNSPEGQIARNYLASRGMDQDAIEHFKLGYSLRSWDALIRWAGAIGYDQSDLLATGLIIENEERHSIYDRFQGRLMFPIWDENGKVVGFSARILVSSQDPNRKEAKYINSPETEFFKKSRILYGLNFARPNLRKTGYALVCEGQLDVISCHRAGLVCAVAGQGTAFTEEHARMLRKSVQKVVLSFDADNAGYKAAKRTITLLHAQDIAVSVVTLPEGEDPDSVFKKGGAESLQALMNVQEPAIPYLFRVFSLTYDIGTPDGKSQIVKHVLQAIKPLSDPVVKISHCQWLAEQLKLPQEIIIKMLETVPDSEDLGHAPARRGNGQGQNGNYSFAQAKPAAPVYFPLVQPADQLWKTLLDLLLHYQDFVPVFEQEFSLLGALPNTPLGQAVSQLLVFYDQGEWESAAMQLKEQEELFKEPMVAQVLMDSEYAENAGEAKDEGKARAMAERAFHDCMNRLKLKAITDEIEAKQRAVSQETDDEKSRQLSQEIADLIREKNQLRQALRN